MEIGEVNHASKIKYNQIHFTDDGNFLWVHTQDGSTKVTIANGEILNIENNLTGTQLEAKLYGKINRKSY